MNRQLITTADGSHTLFVPDLNESYHSRNGAITESQHVYIQAGLQPLLLQYPVIYILEIGFGTGLNAWLTLLQAIRNNQQVMYHAIEPYPLSMEEAAVLNYTTEADHALFMQLHKTAWEQAVAIHPNFYLYKHACKLDSDAWISTGNNFHLVYFDAFAPAVQPELWTKAVFEKIYSQMHNGGVLVTYSSKSSVRKAMQTAGFTIEKLAGPPGKREMLRAKKQ